jgi:thiol:disulfide interchange protein DsbC
MRAKNLSAVFMIAVLAVSLGGDLVSSRAESGNTTAPQKPVVEDAKTAPVREALKKGFPNLQPLSIDETAIKGLYEIEAGSNIIYFYPEKDLLVFGEIWTKDGRNITAEKKAQIATARLKDVPLDKAVKIGNGKNKVIEFTDPDCPYCRKASAFLKGRDDVTLYVFFFPLPIHKEAEAHARYVLCAADKAHALEEVMNGQLDGKEVTACPDKKADALLREHKDLGTKLGVRGTPAFWINGQYVAGANIPVIEGLLGQKMASQTKQ